jgi:anti-sigma B factor antagonist
MNDVITEEHDDLLLVKLSGEVDLSWSGRVRDTILEALEHHSVGVDLSAVSYIDSSGIAALVEGLQTARTTERRFVLIATSAPVLAVLELARLDRVFTLLADLSSAQPAETD